MYAFLKSKNILVTGAGAGFGNALCKKLAESGAFVFAVDRNAEQLNELKKDQPTIETINVDLTDWQRVRKELENVPELDGLVNNAGIAITKPFWDLSEQDFDATFNVNVKAIFNVTQTLVPKLKESSSVVMLSSVSALHTFPGLSIYSATKAAVDSLTRSFALELGPCKIRVNSVNPTVVLTAMGRKLWSDPEKAQAVIDRIPLRRFCEVHEVVNAIIFLLSDQSRFVNGHHLSLEGGYAVS